MILKILLVAALFVTATTAGRPRHKAVDNPGCTCGGNIYNTALISTLMNRAAKAEKATVDTGLNVGRKPSYPQKHANTQGIVYELCNGVAADDIHEYPLRRIVWKQGQNAGKYFLIYDAKENKFCGCTHVMAGGFVKKCPLGTDKGMKEGPGESSHPVHNPLAGTVPRVGRT